MGQREIVVLLPIANSFVLAVGVFRVSSLLIVFVGIYLCRHCRLVMILSSKAKDT